MKTLTLTEDQINDAVSSMWGQRLTGKNVNLVALTLDRSTVFKVSPYDEPPQKQSERIAAQSHSRAKADSMEGTTI